MSLPVFVSRNGELIPATQAQVSVFSPAIFGAYGVYEFLQVVHGVIFALGAHLQRLAHSAAILDLPLPADQATLERWMNEVLIANHVADCSLRLSVLGSENGVGATAFIWPQPARIYSPALYSKGAPAITFQGQRTLPAAKSLNTLVNFLAQRKAQAAGAHEALLYHNGYFTEGSSSNLFAVVDGVVVTASSEQVLPGVARDVVLHLAGHHNMHLHEAAMALSDMPRWSECFITSTSRHVMPITVVDGRPVGDGQVGPITHRLMALFEEHFFKSVAR
jgi:branched-subunit amino acid aminotransferase/4-amino-4-deoxychorismate lyase